jgi:hypothetical protein
VFVILLIAVHLSGSATAERQKEFLVMRKPEHTVVLRIYGDKYICASFDSNTKIVEDTLYIIDATKENGLWLDWQKIGPLKPVSKAKTNNRKTI